MSSCVNGDIRLEVSATSMPLIGQRSSDDQTMFGKNGIRAGRVDICVNGTVGTVCSTEWDNQDASVVCTQLGYSPYGKLFSHSIQALSKVRQSGALQHYVLLATLKFLWVHCE